jgi:hypothetical protein
MYQVSVSVKEATQTIRQVPRDLFHPIVTGFRNESDYPNFPRCQANDEQNVIANQASRRPYLRREEVRSRHDVPVTPEELRPAHSLSPIRRSFDSRSLQDTGDRPSAHVMSKV